MSNDTPKSLESVLKRYSKGERDFRGMELDDADYTLAGQDLREADFSESYLTVDFSRSNLRGASFRNANAKTCSFEDADLRECDFRGAALCSTTFKGAQMQGAVFTGASCHSYVLSEGELPSW